MTEMRERDVVLHSRVRLARNFADLPFPSKMTAEDGEEAQRRAADALAHQAQGRDYSLLRVHDLDDATRRALVERRLISRELLSAGAAAALLLRRDERVCILINEDDHLRIHALMPGRALSETAEMAFDVENAISSRVGFAFDAEYGFLTANPTNTGTGMRASAMLHLPALTRSGAIGGLVQEIAKLGLSLRPLYGDDGEAQGELYLLGNQVALGRSEQELIDSIDAIIDQIVDRERASRELLLLSSDAALEDRLMRSLGVLRYARRLGEPEWIRRWSDVRLAVQAGFLPMDLLTLDALLDAVKPAHLELAAGKDLSPTERDEMRAKVIREALE